MIIIIHLFTQSDRKRDDKSVNIEGAQEEENNNNKEEEVLRM